MSTIKWGTERRVTRYNARESPVGYSNTMCESLAILNQSNAVKPKQSSDTTKVLLGPVSRKSRNISGDIILFVSSKRRCSVTWNFAVILIFIPFTAYEKISFGGWAGRSFTNGFSGPKSLRDFRETSPWYAVLWLLSCCEGKCITTDKNTSKNKSNKTKFGE